MFCTQCGTKNPDDARFCRQCGQKVDAVQPVPLDESAFAILQRPEDRVDDLLVNAFRRSEHGDLDGAVHACLEALTIRPDSTSAHSLLGMMYEKRGEREKAITQFEKVLALNPGSIADREKLEQLRDSTTVLTPRHITSPRRLASPTLFESPAGAAMAAIAVFLIVLMAGGWAVWAKNRQQTSAATSVKSGPNNAAYPPIQLSRDTAANPLGPYPNIATGPQSGRSPLSGGAAQAPAVQQPGERTANPAPRRRSTESDAGFVPPVRVNIPSPDRIEQPAASRIGSTESGNTIHLPDSSSASDSGQPPARTNPEPPRPNPGKIEIIVTPGNTTGKAASTGSASDSSIDSRGRRAAAQQAQLRGDYRTAAREYLKALDGAGEDAATIHQQLGLCYQRLEDKDAAISHYNDAIAEYKRQIAAGKNTEAANRGVKACEAGIRASQ